MSGPLDRPLPVAWDGRAVEWKSWIPVGPTFICDRSKRKNGLTIPTCEHCGSVRFLACGGVVEPRPEDRAEGEFLRYGPAGRPIRSMELPAPMLELTAQRCAGCGHDQVYEWATEMTWDLEPEDYGLLGSVAP